MKRLLLFLLCFPALMQAQRPSRTKPDTIVICAKYLELGRPALETDTLIPYLVSKNLRDTVLLVSKGLYHRQTIVIEEWYNFFLVDSVVVDYRRLKPSQKCPYLLRASLSTLPFILP